MKNLRVNDRIRLESVEPEMAPMIFNAIDCDRKYLREWLPFIDSTLYVTDTEDFIEQIIAQKGKRRDEVYAIMYKEEFAGLIGLKDTDWLNRKTEIGYWLCHGMQGKGIMTACVSFLSHFCFGKLGMNRVQLKVAKGNVKSEAIPLRLGFVFEGTEREGELIRGRYHDLSIFSLLRSERMLMPD